MLESLHKEKDLLTWSIKIKYTNLRLISKHMLYHLYEGQTNDSIKAIHTIRAFNLYSEVAKENYESAATLFIKELLHLISIDKNSVIFDTFEITLDKKIVFATLSYAPISCQIKQDQNLITSQERKEESGLHKFNDTKYVKDMIADVLLDMEFLSKEFKIKNCSSLLKPQSIFYFNESGAYFLGDWITAVLHEDQPTTETGGISKLLTSPAIFKEINSLILSIFELNGVDHENLKRLREMEAKNDPLLEVVILGILNKDSSNTLKKELKKLIKGMLDCGSSPSSTLEEFISHISVRRKDMVLESHGLEIDLEECSLSANDLNALITKTMNKWSKLRILNLKGNKIRDKGTIALSGNNTWGDLKTLNLSENEIGVEGAIALGSNSSWMKLTELDLSGNEINEKGTRALSRSNSWRNLTILNLNLNMIGDDGAIELSRNSSWTNLLTLNLQLNKIGRIGATFLSTNKSWKKLAKLNLGWNNIGAEGATALGENDSWKNLATLKLHKNNIGEEGAIGLSKNNSWKSLTTLNLGDNNIDDEGVTALKKTWPSLFRLYYS